MMTTQTDFKPILQIKTHADFRRYLQAEGTKLETLALADGVRDSLLEGRLRVGMVRFVNKADTTGVYLKEKPEDGGRGSFLGYGKASEWTFDGWIATNTKFGYSYRVIPFWRDK
jgi:hypothetical protein